MHSISFVRFVEPRNEAVVETLQFDDDTPFSAASLLKLLKLPTTVEALRTLRANTLQKAGVQASERIAELHVKAIGDLSTEYVGADCVEWVLRVAHLASIRPLTQLNFETPLETTTWTQEQTPK